MLSLGNSLIKQSKRLVNLDTITDSLVLKHKYDAGAVVPVSDGAVDLNGTSDYVSTGFVADYISTNATVAFWVNMKDFSSDQIMGFHNNKRWYHGFSSSSLFIGVANAHNGSSLITPSPALVAGQWYHYCVTAIGGTATVYINGVAQGTMSYTQSSGTDPDSGYFIGARDNGGAGQYLNGYICNVGQWSTGLTQAQIKSIMNKNYADLSDSEKTNLEAWWNLDSTTTYDAIGSHEDLALDETITLGNELLTGFINGTSYPFNTFTSSGRDISAAIETSGDWGGCSSNSLNVTAGEWYKCTFNLTYNSGTDTIRMTISNGPGGASSAQANYIWTNTNGENTVYFKIASTDSAAYLQIGTGEAADVINFSMSDISLKKITGNIGELK